MFAVPRPIIIDGTPPRLRALRALAAASVIAPLVAFFAYAAVSYFQSFRAAEARALHISALLQEHGERVFETIELALSDVRALLAGHSDEEIRTSKELWDAVKSRQTAGPQLGSIFVVGPDGSDLLTSRAFPAPPPVDFSDRDYFLAQKDKDAGVYLSGRYLGKISRIPIFNLSIRRSYPDGRFAGVVGSSGFADYFQNFYATVGDPEDDFAVALVRSDGEVLVRYPTIDASSKANLEFIANSPHTRHVGYRVSSIDGKQRLYATSKLGQYPAFVSYTISNSAIRTQWATDLAIPALVSILSIIFLFGLSSIALRRASREGAAIRELAATSETLKRETERRQQAESVLLQAQKLEAVGRLTSGIAHDFNNLLTIILGNLSMAKKRVGATGATRSLEAAEEAAKRGAALTGQLLTFSRGQSMRPSNVDLNEVLATAKVWMHQAVGDGVELKLEIASGILPITVDVAQLEAALLNLVVNARDAIDRRGTITIRSFAAHAPKDTPVSLLSGKYAAVSVVDNGSGIPQELINKVFEPFFTTKSPSKGTGLGLSQVHGFVRHTGGDIRIESLLGKGTAITLFFPLQSRIEVKPVTETTVTAAAPRSVRKVTLVVEDDDEVRKPILEMLMDLGHSPLLARSAQEALGILSAGGHVDIVLTDIGLPGPDGVELASEVRSRSGNIKVILMTALLQIENPEAYPVLRKPFDKSRLAEALERL